MDRAKQAKIQHMRVREAHVLYILRQPSASLARCALRRCNRPAKQARHGITCLAAQSVLRENDTAAIKLSQNVWGNCNAAFDSSSTLGMSSAQASASSDPMLLRRR